MAPLLSLSPFKQIYKILAKPGFFRMLVISKTILIVDMMTARSVLRTSRNKN